MDFCQTFVTGAPRHRDELIRFWGQKVKVQGHTIAAAEAHSTQRYRRVQLFLVLLFFMLTGFLLPFWIFLLLLPVVLILLLPVCCLADPFF